MFHGAVNYLKAIFFMDFNEDRQATFEKSFTHTGDFSFDTKILQSEESKQASIFLDTVGMYSDA